MRVGFVPFLSAQRLGDDLCSSRAALHILNTALNKYEYMKPLITNVRASMNSPWLVALTFRSRFSRLASYVKTDPHPAPGARSPEARLGTAAVLAGRQVLPD